MRPPRPILALALGAALAAAAGAAPARPGPQAGFLGGSDDCQTPTVLPGTGTFPFDLSAATTGTEGQSEPLCYMFGFGLSGIDSDVWFEWTSPCTGDVTLSTCTLGTNVDTKCAAYPGPGCPLDGTALACMDDSCGVGLFQAEISWPATIGTTYTLQVGTFPGAATGSGSMFLSVASCGGQTTPLCFGDGTGTTCPCGNPGGPGEGCANGTGQGAALSSSGSSSVSAADLALLAAGLPATQPGLFFQGDNFVGGGAGVPFGDGLRCCGQNVVRLELVPSDGGGASATSVDVAAAGGAAPGDVKCYQHWYRDPQGSLCGTGFNLSNALEVVWIP